VRLEDESRSLQKWTLDPVAPVQLFQILQLRGTVHQRSILGGGAATFPSRAPLFAMLDNIDLDINANDTEPSSSSRLLGGESVMVPRSRRASWVLARPENTEVELLVRPSPSPSPPQRDSAAKRFLAFGRGFGSV
jgi:hypothetical protein